MKILNMNWTAGMHRLNFQRVILMICPRFREIPAFGRDGVRKITSNRSELKKMTAHDYEDMLQASMELFNQPT